MSIHPSYPDGAGPSTASIPLPAMATTAEARPSPLLPLEGVTSSQAKLKALLIEYKVINEAGDLLIELDETVLPPLPKILNEVLGSDKGITLRTVAEALSDPKHRNLREAIGPLHLSGGAVRALWRKQYLLALLEPHVPRSKLEPLLEEPAEICLDKDLIAYVKRGHILEEIPRLLVYAVQPSLFPNLLPHEVAQEKFVGKMTPIRTATNNFLVGKIRGDNCLIEIKIVENLERDHLFSVDSVTLPIEGPLALRPARFASSLKGSRSPVAQAIIDYHTGRLTADEPEVINYKGFPRLVSLCTKGRSATCAFSQTLWNALYNGKDLPQHLVYLQGAKRVDAVLHDCFQSHHIPTLSTRILDTLNCTRVLEALDLHPFAREIWAYSFHRPAHGKPTDELSQFLSDIADSLQKELRRDFRSPLPLTTAWQLLDLVAVRTITSPGSFPWSVTIEPEHLGSPHWRFAFPTEEPTFLFVPIQGAAARELSRCDENETLHFGYLTTLAYGPIESVSSDLNQELATYGVDLARLRKEQLLWQMNQRSAAKIAAATTALQSFIKECSEEELALALEPLEALPMTPALGEIIVLTGMRVAQLPASPLKAHHCLRLSQLITQTTKPYPSGLDRLASWITRELTSSSFKTEGRAFLAECERIQLLEADSSAYFKAALASMRAALELGELELLTDELEHYKHSSHHTKNPEEFKQLLADLLYRSVEQPSEHSMPLLERLLPMLPLLDANKKRKGSLLPEELLVEIAARLCSVENYREAGKLLVRLLNQVDLSASTPKLDQVLSETVNGFVKKEQHRLVTNLVRTFIQKTELLSARSEAVQQTLVSSYIQSIGKSALPSEEIAEGLKSVQAIAGADPADLAEAWSKLLPSAASDNLESALPIIREGLTTLENTATSEQKLRCFTKLYEIVASTKKSDLQLESFTLLVDHFLQFPTAEEIPLLLPLHQLLLQYSSGASRELQFQILLSEKANVLPGRWIEAWEASLVALRNKEELTKRHIPELPSRLEQIVEQLLQEAKPHQAMRIYSASQKHKLTKSTPLFWKLLNALVDIAPMEAYHLWGGNKNAGGPEALLCKLRLARALVEANKPVYAMGCTSRLEEPKSEAERQECEATAIALFDQLIANKRFGELEQQVSADNLIRYLPQPKWEEAMFQIAHWYASKKSEPKALQFLDHPLLLDQAFDQTSSLAAAIIAEVTDRPKDGPKKALGLLNRFPHLLTPKDFFGIQKLLLKALNELGQLDKAWELLDLNKEACASLRLALALRCAKENRGHPRLLSFLQEIKEVEKPALLYPIAAGAIRWAKTQSQATFDEVALLLWNRRDFFSKDELIRDNSGDCSIAYSRILAAWLKIGQAPNPDAIFEYVYNEFLQMPEWSATRIEEGKAYGIEKPVVSELWGGLIEGELQRLESARNAEERVIKAARLRLIIREAIHATESELPLIKLLYRWILCCSQFNDLASMQIALELLISRTETGLSHDNVYEFSLAILSCYSMTIRCTDSLFFDTHVRLLELVNRISLNGSEFLSFCRYYATGMVQISFPDHEKQLNHLKHLFMTFSGMIGNPRIELDFLATHLPKVFEAYDSGIKACDERGDHVRKLHSLISSQIIFMFALKRGVFEKVPAVYQSAHETSWPKMPVRALPLSEEERDRALLDLIPRNLAFITEMENPEQLLIEIANLTTDLFQSAHLRLEEKSDLLNSFWAIPFNAPPGSACAEQGRKLTGTMYISLMDFMRANGFVGAIPPPEGKGKGPGN